MLRVVLSHLTVLKKYYLTKRAKTKLRFLGYRLYANYQ